MKQDRLFLGAGEQRFQQTRRPTYSSLFRMPVPRRQLPLIVHGPQALPTGPGTFLRLSACAIALGDLPAAYSLKT
jgi:hypothetical protein